ncbi:MAG: hypothetical protein ACKESB_00865 [Candidatus Hodgkinia cicadicola]
MYQIQRKSRLTYLIRQVVRLFLVFRQVKVWCNRRTNVPNTSQLDSLVIIEHAKLDLGTTRIMKTCTERMGDGFVVESDGCRAPEVCVSASSGENVKQLMDMLCAMLDVGKPECDVRAQAECVVLDVSAKALEASNGRCYQVVAIRR